MKISIVIPAYNEEQNIDFIYKEISALSLAGDSELELIFIDDGSRDSTF
ncbi:MAG TPA: glycosyltransferase, partial [Bacteroidaceae bacterium]|nr:glycosyltransferase [Bacteroidaceae bacterium]